MIKRYNEFINEGYEEKPEYQIKTFFNEFEKNINFYFEQGAFATDDIELIDIKQINVNSMEKNIMFDFQDSEFYYQVIVVIDIVAVTEEGLKDCYVKVKKYNSDSELIRTLGEDVSIKDLDEDKIVELFSKLDEESETATSKTISDDDSDLDDTSVM